MTDDEKSNRSRFVNWDCVKNIYGIVVAADAEPNDRYGHSTYPGIPLQTIKARLRDNHFAAPQKFWRARKERKWLGGLRQCQESHRSIEIGDVTYRLPVLVEPAEQANE